MSIYLVTAYRCGNTNEHQYQVYCGPDRTKAIALAKSEREDRGGKYDCAVYEFDGDGTDYNLIEYFASYGEQTKPKRNWRIDYYKQLGQFMDDYADGRCLLPNSDRPGTLIYTPVTPDSLVVVEVKRKREWLDRLQVELAKVSNT